MNTTPNNAKEHKPKYNLYPNRYLCQYSLGLKMIFDSLGFKHIDTVVHPKTNKTAYIYERTDAINWFLCMLRVNKDLDINIRNIQVASYFKRKQLLPNTVVHNYVSRLLYVDKSFDVNKFVTQN